jgi:hypothetical protein
MPKDAAPDNTMPPPNNGTASMQLSATQLDFSMAVCNGAMGTSEQLIVTNNGTGTLAVAAKVTGAAFTISPTSLSVAPGMTGTVTVTANIVSTAAAGMMVSGSLSLFTNDPTRGSVTLPLTATATGATLSLQPGDPTTYAFPTTAVGGTSAPITLHLVNTGNAAATFTLTPPSDPEFVLSPLPGGTMSMLLNPNDLMAVTATFTPTSAAMVTGTTGISTSNPTCGTSVAALSFSGQGGKGTVNGWPTTLDFGSANCGAATAPGQQSFTLTNSGPADAHITTVTLSGAPGFTTSAKPGRAIYASGGVLAITVDAPPVPANSPTTPVTATLSIGTDADASPHTITLTEEPSGAILEWDTSATTNFGSFGPVVLLKSTTQDFKIKNSGSASASVTLSVVQGSGDSDAGEGGSPGGASPFVLTTPAFSVNGPGEQDETVVFTPQTAQPVTGSIVLTATGAVCGALPPPIPLAGSGLGGGPTVVPTSLVVGAKCDGTVPTPQTFVVRNDGTADFTWSLALGTGVQFVDAGSPEAAPPLYQISANPAPGLLHPGGISTVTVSGTQIPKFGANPDLSTYAAQVTITTDVPLDPPHVVSITENPLGDQITMTGPTPLRFGQIPIGTSIPQNLVVTNFATAGSPAANLSFVLSSTVDGGASAYTVTPPAYANLASGIGASTRETVTFAPTAAMSYPATLTIDTGNDPVCTPLPPPLTLSGTGTNGHVAVSAVSITFGSDPTDPAGLVNCGLQGLAHTFTVTNVGNQAFNLTGLALGLGAASPYQVSGAGTLPATLPIGGGVTITVTPTTMPKNVATPNDNTPFKDTLTITTDATGDTPHTVGLVMQARGAVIVDAPITTNWPFGTVSFGSIGTFTNSITNSGNSGVTIGITGLAHPSIFGLQNSRTKVPGGNPAVVTSVVGTFAPPASDGSWSDMGSLAVTADQALCEPLPMQWNNPMVTMSGTSDSTPAVTWSGSLVFPTTECGSAAPPPQTITLTNASNVAYPYTLSFSSGGKYYSTTPTADAGGPDGGAGTVPAKGSAQILVTPHAVTMGPGVLPGSAPYADELLVTVETNPPTPFTIPISWSLSGAVLSLPPGSTKTDPTTHQAYYPADSTGTLTLPILNTGSEPVTINYSTQPTGVFSISPMPPVVIPAVSASSAPTALFLVAPASGDPSCTASPFAPAVGSAALYIVSGAVCQPLPDSVVVESCSGTFPPDATPDAGSNPPDAGSDAGPDATADASDGSSGSSPCASFNGGQGCTATEQLFVQHDPTNGCYDCLVNAGCLDDSSFGDVGHECGDFATQTQQNQCTDTINCILGSSCAQTSVAVCYCGTAPVAGTCQGNPAAGPINGACASQIATGLGFPETDGTDITKNLTDTTLPAGMGVQIFVCAEANHCASCLQ